VHFHRIPLEIRVPKEKVPIYEDSLEDLGRSNEQPILPFNAFGTLAWARSEFENNSASSQIFWLLKESELTPSGANLLDGRYAVFGYIVDVRSRCLSECDGRRCLALHLHMMQLVSHHTASPGAELQGQEDLLDMKVGDKINYMKVR
jgi:cyclophilin family peptidyl-prolyl cis-trans isomerase